MIIIKNINFMELEFKIRDINNRYLFVMNGGYKWFLKFVILYLKG